MSEREEGTAGQTGQAAEGGPDKVRACLKSTHANTLAKLECLRACVVDGEGDGFAYREVEEALAQNATVKTATQGVHVLIDALVQAGGIVKTPVPEEAPELADWAPEAPETPAAEPADQAPETPDAEPAQEEPAPEPSADAAADSPQQAEPAPGDGTAPKPEDQPVDYLLRTSEAGRAVLEEFSPVRRFLAVIADETQERVDAYAKVLVACEAQGGLSRQQVEAELGDDPALTYPTRVYPDYFVSRLESVGGLVWDKKWCTTAAGELMLDALASR